MAVEDFVAAVVEDFVVEAVEASVVVVLAVLAASVSAVSALESVLAVSVSFNCFGSLCCCAPITFPKDKNLFCKSKVPLRNLPAGALLKFMAVLKPLLILAQAHVLGASAFLIILDKKSYIN
ncbi:hypothetical protein ABES03_15260 [Neobacillus rhizosphaerae]